MVLLKISPNPNSNSYSVNIEADDLKTLKDKIESVFHLKVKNITALNGVTIFDQEDDFKILINEYKIDSFSFSTNSFNDEFRLDELEVAYPKLIQFFVRNLTNVLIKVFIREHEFRDDDNSNDLNNYDLMKLKQYISLDNNLERAKLYANLTRLIEKQISENVDEILSDYRSICAYYNALIKQLLFNKNSDLEIAVPKNSQLSKINIFSNSSNNLEISFRNCHLTGASGFIEKALLVWKNILLESREPTPNEYLMIHLAYYKLKMPGNIQCLLKYSCGMGTPGFRDRAQTFMAITDSGKGHLLGTLFKKKWLDNGVIVNLEHLDIIAQGLNGQSFRIPSFRKFKWIRLNVADIAPQTIFIGRIHNDSHNISRLTVSCLDNMFNIGAAECKLSMANSKTYECVKYMRTVVFEVARNPYQILCAAWNLNDEFRDDLISDSLQTTADIRRKECDLTIVKDRFQIAKLAILYTKLGGFDKVAWNGAYETYLSQSIVPYQLKISEAFTLVHMAHSVGLLTYFSGGFSLKEIKFGVLTGVDSINVDGHELRYIDRNTGNHGPFQHENIDYILDERTRFEECFIGKCVLLLCRLDTMFYEGSLTKEENVKRLALFNTLNGIYSEIDNRLADSLEEGLLSFDRLVSLKTNELELLKNSLDYILELQADDNTNLKRSVYLNKLARFNRNSFQLNQVLLLEDCTTDEIDKFKNRIGEILRENSEQKAFSFYANRSWKKYVRKHQDEVLRQLFRNSKYECKL